MKSLSLFALILVLMFSRHLFAQATATPIQQGQIVTSGCPGGQLSCFQPVGSSTPLPVYFPLGH